MIEFVNEWLAPQGKLRGLIQDERQFASSQVAAQQALAAARVAGMPVIHATLQLSSDYRELGHRRFGLRGAIPNAGTWRKQDSGWQFYPPFAPRPDEFVISGRAGASAFAASDLDNYLRGQRITRLYLAGYATHVCIESTLRAAHDLGYEPVVLSDATAAFTAAQQQHVLSEVVHHFGWAMPTQAFIAELTSPGASAKA
ncbi:cysteine hydrolase [Burkholderia sp. Ac-20353]|nr:cysteine hydrolase [Burkholderia sp. Ac-20353]